MDSSKIYGGIEECHSSESGWTMYIGSPVGGYEGEGSDDGRHGEKTAAAAAADDDGYDHSDDSMVSDASSGPSHRHGTTTLYFKHDEDERDCFSDKKGKKSVEKQKPGLMKNKQDKDVKKETPLKAKRALSDPCRTGSKVRQSTWLGKRN